jgi:hypothetical protein
MNRRIACQEKERIMDKGAEKARKKHRAYREGPSIGHPNNRINGWIAAFDFEKKKLEKFKVFTLNDKNVMSKNFV